MNLIGATVRYPVPGCKRTEQSRIAKTLRTKAGEIAFKLENGRVLADPPFMIIRLK